MNALVDIAFGRAPGCWPLPPATTPEEHWLRAVAAGGQGRYGRAFADLDAVARTPIRGPLASLASSTRASFLRQLGGHVPARGWDGRAWALAAADVDAGTDALIGLAADALGVGRFALSGRLLQRAEELLGAAASGRLPVRLAWVRAELAMAAGEGEAAVGHAERAVELAASTGSTRHEVKSSVVLAAALCSIGDVDASRRLADEAFVVTKRLGLVPLGWALACLLTGIGSANHPSSRMAATRDEFAAELRRRGGVWAAR